MTIMTVLRLFGGAFTTVVAIALFVFLAQILGSPSTATINPELIDSLPDKIFFVFMMGGAGMGYAVMSWYFFPGKKLSGSPFAAAILSGLLFISGIYYHMIFGSPW
jgi:hypothetical protein